MTDTPFRTPEEWSRAQAACVGFFRAYATDSTLLIALVPNLFSQLYPCPPEPDTEGTGGVAAYAEMLERVNADQLRREPPRPAIEAALDAFEEQVIADSVEPRAIARQRVLDLAQQGEEMDVESVGDFSLELGTDREAVSLRFVPGDRVRVVKVNP